MRLVSWCISRVWTHDGVLELRWLLILRDVFFPLRSISLGLVAKEFMAEIEVLDGLSFVSKSTR
jgi:hypothetical protein